MGFVSVLCAFRRISYLTLSTRNSFIEVPVFDIDKLAQDVK